MPFLPKYITNPSVEFHFSGIFLPISTLARVLFPARQGPPYRKKIHDQLNVYFEKMVFKYTHRFILVNAAIPIHKN